MFFEGSEKKVEIVFQPSLSSMRNRVSFWQTVVAKANASILSTLKSPACDAYLLSESSLFVFDHSVVMITCGTTSLANAVKTILEEVSHRNIRLFMYERKNELHPEEQPSDFNRDIALFQSWLPGQAVCLGRPTGNHVRLFHYSRDYVPPANDMTLEILMHDLSARTQHCFRKNQEKTATMGEVAQLNDIFQGFQQDDYFFDPEGYSLNGIRGAEYYTVHVTPQEPGSYASFETNHLFTGDLEPTLYKVLDVFQPRSFSVVFFQNHGLDFKIGNGYELRGEIRQSFSGYQVLFRNYKRPLSGSEK